MSVEKVELVRTLFLTGDFRAGSVSCALCHDPAFAFTDANSLAAGVADKKGARNTPTILNAMFSELLFWDGRAASLEEQVLHPISSPFEMGMDNQKEFVDSKSILSIPASMQAVRNLASFPANMIWFWDC